MNIYLIKTNLLCDFQENIAENLLQELISPLLLSLKDTDAKIRFSACEALYNEIKCLREVSLKYFNEIFKALVNVIADTDEDVRKAAQTLDRILKDVVTESTPNS